MILSNLLTIANLVLLIGTIIGGYMAIRSAVSKAESDVQTRVREALSAENELLQARVARLEKDNKRQSNLMQLLISMLKKTYHIDIDIDEDMITLRDANGQHTGRIPDIA